MTKARVAERAVVSATSIPRMRASGGGSDVIVWMKAATASAGPSISVMRPEDELRAKPVSSRRRAMR